MPTKKPAIAAMHRRALVVIFVKTLPVKCDHGIFVNEHGMQRTKASCTESGARLPSIYAELIDEALISFTFVPRPYLTGRATFGRLELPPGEGRFVGPPYVKPPHA